MYLGTALKIAIPLAIQDREAMAEAHGFEGQDADAAMQACRDMKKLHGVKPATFTADQRELARMTLLWGEQYLQGFMEAVIDSDPAEFNLARKRRQQIRGVRFLHFGKTSIEAAMQNCSLVDVTDGLLWNSPNIVACPVCKTRTNAAVAGDSCRNCKTGIFQ